MPVTKTLTNLDVLNLNMALGRYGDAKNKRLAYAVARNRNKLKEFIEALEEARKPSDAVKEWEEARIELCKKHADMDEKNRPIMRGPVGAQSYDIADQILFDKELKKLKKKFPEGVKEQEEQNEQYKELLKEEVTFTPYQIKFSLIPDNVVAARDLENFIEAKIVVFDLDDEEEDDGDEDEVEEETEAPKPKKKPAKKPRKRKK